MKNLLNINFHLKDKLAHDANQANIAAGGQNWRIGSYKNTHCKYYYYTIFNFI